MNLELELTSNKEPSSCTRHAKSIPSKARIAPCVQLAHIGESQCPIWRKCDPIEMHKQREHFFYHQLWIWNIGNQKFTSLCMSGFNFCLHSATPLGWVITCHWFGWAGFLSSIKCWRWDTPGVYTPASRWFLPWLWAELSGRSLWSLGERLKGNDNPTLVLDSSKMSPGVLKHASHVTPESIRSRGDKRQMFNHNDIKSSQRVSPPSFCE